MKILKTLTLIFVFVVFLVLGLIYQASLGAERTVLNLDYYQGLTEETEISSRIHESLKEILVREMKKELPEEMKEKSFFIIGSLEEVFDEEWLQDQFLLVAEDFLYLVEGEQEELKAVIDLRGEKEQLKILLREGFQEVLREEEIPLSHEIVDSVIEETVRGTNIPDQIYLNQLVEEEMVVRLKEASSYVQFFRNYFFISSFVLFVLLSLSFLVLSGISGGLKWIGWSALVSGLTFLSGLFLTRFFIISLVDLEDIFVDILNELLAYTVGVLFIIPVLFSLFGLIFIIIGFLLKKKF